MPERTDENLENVIPLARNPEKRKLIKYQIELQRAIQSQLAEILTQGNNIPPLKIEDKNFDFFEMSDEGIILNIQKFYEVIKSLIEQKKKEFSVKMPGINFFLIPEMRDQSHRIAYQFWRNNLMEIIDFTARQQKKRTFYQASMTDNDVDNPSKIPGIELKVNIY